MRKRLMGWWWRWRTPLPVQLGAARVLCWAYGHEWTRYRWCDWCGKESHG